MKCPSCGSENEDSIKFCGNCGTKLPEAAEPPGKKPICSQCGQENPPGARFCQGCGVELSQAAPIPTPVKKRKSGWLWGIFGALVLTLALGSFFFFNRSEPLPPTRAVAKPTQRQEAACKDKLAFIADVTVPDGTVLAPGEAFTKTWRLKNTGTCPWSTSYRLAFKQGQQMSAPGTVALTREVSPGQEIDLSVDFKAPADAGSYKSFWHLQNAQGEVVPLDGVSSNAFFVDIRVQPGEEGLLLRDDFNDQSGGWSIFGDAKGEVGYQDGNFRIAFYKPMGFHASWSKEQYTDFIVETVFSTPADVPDVGAGFTLRTQEKQWYLLWVYPAQGKYLFRKDVSGQVTELVPLKASPVIRPLVQGGRLSLQLKVVARGDEFEIWIAQPDSTYAYLDTVSDPELKTGHLGPSADCPDGAFRSPVEVLFEWIKIWK